MSDQVLIREENNVLRVAINNPEKKNSLTKEIYEGLIAAFDQAESTPSVRVLLLESAAEGIFSAGNDMESFLQIKNHDGKSEVPSLTLMKRAALAKKPLIAAVNGAAIGLGTTLLLSFDLIYASEEARFKTPFVNLGAVPEAGSSRLLQEFVGRQAAAEMLLLGDFISAQRAYEMGLVNKIVPQAELEETALAAARTIAGRPPEAVHITKELMRGDTAPLIELIEKEMRLFGEQARSPELEEAVMAFLQKREPDFSKFWK
jgi:enoyl-CoA hydratase/carnithine racemase